MVGVIGLEIYSAIGLLRSLAVAPSYRGRCLGRELVTYAESLSIDQGVGELYLLTSTAEKFFTRLGYRQASRSNAPAVIKRTSQFAGLCPASSAFMSKQIGAASRDLEQ